MNEEQTNNKLVPMICGSDNFECYELKEMQQHMKQKHGYNQKPPKEGADSRTCEAVPSIPDNDKLEIKLIHLLDHLAEDFYRTYKTEFLQGYIDEAKSKLKSLIKQAEIKAKIDELTFFKETHTNDTFYVGIKNSIAHLTAELEKGKEYEKA